MVSIMGNQIKNIIEKCKQNRQAIRAWKEDSNTKRLFEVCGLLLYNKEELIEKVKEISNELLLFIDKPMNRYVTDSYIIIFDDNDDIIKMKSKFFSFDLNMLLIKKLFILISFDDIYNTDFIITSIDNPEKSIESSFKYGYRYEYVSVIININDNITRKDIMDIIIKNIIQIYDYFDCSMYI